MLRILFTLLLVFCLSIMVISCGASGPASAEAAGTSVLDAGVTKTVSTQFYTYQDVNSAIAISGSTVSFSDSVGKQVVVVNTSVEIKEK